MELFLLYLFTRLDRVVMFFGVSGAILAITGFIAFMLYADSYGEEAALYIKRAKQFIMGALVCIFGAILIPTQRDAAIILAGWGVLEVARSETAGRLAGKSVQLIEQTLDGYLAKSKGETK